MAARRLHIAQDLSLPLDFATKTAAILAQRRKGKTYTASVIAEEMVASKQPFVALDPTGAWWGLRAGADGMSEGLPVVVLGGSHGDVPLERTGGSLIADLVVEEPGYYVIDFSLFESGEAERQFAVDFAERLYRAKGQAGRDFPLHLFVDEADRFIPQQMRKGSNDTSPRLLGAFEAIVRRGGLRGLGTTLISQRAAVVNKNVLEMLDILFTLRTVGPNDQDAILNYIKRHGDENVRTEMMGSLASLGLGELWVWEPGAEPPLFERVHIRQRHTFNSSATPTHGVKRVEPKRLADVDIASLQKRMAATIEKAKAEDPRELRRQIAEKNKEIARLVLEVARQPNPKTPSGGQPVKPVLTDADRALLEKVAARIEQAISLHHDDLVLAGERLKSALNLIGGEYTSKVIDVAGRAEHQIRAIFEATSVQKLIGKLAHVQSSVVATTRQTPQQPFPGQASRSSTPPPQRAPRVTDGSGAAGDLPPGERAVLTAALQYAGLDRKRLGVLTGYKRSSRDAYILRLAQRGFVVAQGQALYPTEAGKAALDGSFEPLPTGPALVDYWRARLPEGELAVLEVLVAANGHDVDRERIDEATGYKRSSRDAYLTRLKSRGLVEFVGRGLVRASEELFA